MHFAEGWVVCEEFVDTLKSAWEEAQSAKAEKQAQKKSKRALDNWRLLVRSVAKTFAYFANRHELSCCNEIATWNFL